MLTKKEGKVGVTSTPKSEPDAAKPVSKNTKLTSAETAKPAVGQPPVAPAPETEKEGRSSQTMWRLIIGLVGAVVVIIIVLIIVVGVGMYKFNWYNQLTRAVNTIVPYPAVVINYAFLPYTSYQGDVATLNYFYDAQAKANPSLSSRPSAAYLQKSVLSRMVREEFLTEAAKGFKITVTQQDVDREFNAIVSQAGSAQEVTDTLQELYRWTDAQFKEKVLKPYVIRAKVQEYIAASESINAAAKKKAEEVLARVKEGKTPFADLAKQYSEDTTASAGGDLGFFGTGDMVKEFEDAVLVLQPGQTSGIVQSPYGYHIIQLIEKVAATGDTPEQFHAAHILIKSKSLDEWINEELAKKSIWVLVGGYAFKKDCGLVLAASETCSNNELTPAGNSNQNSNTNTAPPTNSGDTSANTNTATNTNQ